MISIWDKTCGICVNSKRANRKSVNQPAKIFPADQTTSFFHMYYLLWELQLNQCDVAPTFEDRLSAGWTHCDIDYLLVVELSDFDSKQLTTLFKYQISQNPLFKSTTTLFPNIVFVALKIKEEFYSSSLSLFLDPMLIWFFPPTLSSNLSTHSFHCVFSVFETLLQFFQQLSSHPVFRQVWKEILPPTGRPAKIGSFFFKLNWTHTKYNVSSSRLLDRRTLKHSSPNGHLLQPLDHSDSERSME